MSIRQIKKIPVFHQSGYILVEFTKQKELELKTASVVTHLMTIYCALTM